MGLLRLWMVVATAIWLVTMVGVAWAMVHPFGFTTFYNFLGWARGTLRDLAGWLFIPPVVALAVGAALLWAFRGFRRS